MFYIITRHIIRTEIQVAIAGVYIALLTTCITAPTAEQSTE